MNGINSAHLVGNLGADPEVRYTEAGKAVCTLSVATAYRDQTTWHRVVVWDRTAEFAGDHLKKGDLVYVSGRIDKRKYIDKSGSEATSTEIVAHTLQALGPKDRGSEGRTGPARDYPEPDGNTIDDGSLPF